MEEVLKLKQKIPDEAAIRRQINDHVEALCAMNLDDVMLIYDPDIVSFDLEPPLWYTGLESKKEPWAAAFALVIPPLCYEVRNLSITVDHELAFSHSVNRMKVQLKNGQQIDFWLRWTACFKKTGSTWLIVHEQVSVPVDFMSGRALFDLHPG